MYDVLKLRNNMTEKIQATYYWFKTSAFMILKNYFELLNVSNVKGLSFKSIMSSLLFTHTLNLPHSINSINIASIPRCFLLSCRRGFFSRTNNLISSFITVKFKLNLPVMPLNLQYLTLFVYFFHFLFLL